MPVSAAIEASEESLLIGFIGLGAMGGPMARRLATLGLPLLAYDINRRAVQSVVACGARAAASPKAVASAASIVFTCLPSLAALREVALGDDGLQAGRAIKIYVDLSTTGPQFAREVSAALKRAGITMVDSPITTGGVQNAAKEGKLTIMSSGPRAAFRNAEPILKQLGSNVVYIGAKPGQAQTMKLLNNLLSTAGMAASCEAFVLGVKAGLDPEIMLEIINSGEASSSATRNRFPHSVLPRCFNFGARMAITIKDITLCVKEAEELGVPMWVAQAARQLWAYAISQGASENDSTTLITYLESWAGVEVRGRAAGKRIRTRAIKRTTANNDFVLLCEDRMKSGLARRLREQGWLVAVDSPARKQAAKRSGSRKASASAATDHHCTLVCVPSGNELRDFVVSWRRAHEGKRNQPIVNLCSIPSTEAVALDAALANRRTTVYLDAPLTGTPRDAGQGTLTVIVAGPKPAFEQAQAVLHAIGSQVFYVGERPGAAQVMHQINGSLSSTLFALACEAFVAGAKAGLPPETMTRVMSNGSGRNAASARIIPEQVVTRQFKHGKRIVDACRELTLTSEDARRQGVTMWIADKARQLYALAAQLGRPQDDITRLITHYEKWANVEVTAAARPELPG
ncbi:MAG: NAD(P)-dependent oxidoreductase [Betaproteobacteria bacterium]|nr:NAD(P)-dependent oxidoreductase [Betaproteobacteria bacterium]